MQQSRDKAADSDLRGMPADLSKFYPPTPTYEPPESRGETDDRSPKTHMIGAVMTGESGMKVAVRRGEFKFIEKNDDIGRERVGKPSSVDLVRREAQRLLERDYSGTKKALCIDLSNMLARHHRDDPQMTWAVVGRNITDIWQAHRPQRRYRSPRKID